MGLNRSFEILSGVIERFERTGWGVRNVETDCIDDGRLRATIVLALPRCASATEPETAALQPTGASVAPDGTLSVEYATDDLPLVDDRAGVTASIRGVEVEDGDLHLSQRVVIDPEEGPDGPMIDRQASETTPARESVPAGQTGGSTPSGDGDGPDTQTPSTAANVRDESLPAYEDHAYLEALYEACETFAEMRSAIDMDVSAETVRRYMIDAGVHEPASYESTGPERAQHSVSSARAEAGVDPAQSHTNGTEPVITADQLRTDGVGLPEDLALTEVVEAIANARSIYEVSQALGLDQDRARSLLGQLDCLDLVSYRLTEVQERTTSYEDVARRIRECAPEGA